LTFGLLKILNFADLPVSRELLSEFVDESLERVQHAQDCLLALERSPLNKPAYVALLRALHTIKGNSGYLGAEEFVYLTHAMEELLIQLQARNRLLGEDEISALLEGIEKILLPESSAEEVEIGAPVRLRVWSQPVDTVGGRVTHIAPAAEDSGDVEIGMDIAHSQYHKHGGYLVRYMDMPGYSSWEQRQLAALVRAHRRKFPMAEPAFAGPQGTRLVRLAVLLRIAVVLHRNRGTRPLPHVGLSVEGERLSLSLPSAWLRRHPLTRLDLKQEAAFLNAVPLHLSVSTR
jgi:HPt (histidine-containing phosphotransfer) domain-containing protein